MIEYQTVKIKLSDFELYKLRSAPKNVTDVTLRLSSGMILMQLIFHIIFYWLIDKSICNTFAEKLSKRHKIIKDSTIQSNTVKQIL